MTHRIWILIAVPLILGCAALFPSTPDSQPLAESTLEFSTDENHFIISRVHKSKGSLNSQLREEAAKASELGFVPFIEFDATWCPPCKAINASLEAGDEITLQAFEGIYLVRADVDEWGWGDGQTFIVEAIPVYYKLDENGLPTGDVVDGGVWNEDIPENFAPVLDDFFHGN